MIRLIDGAELERLILRSNRERGDSIGPTRTDIFRRLGALRLNRDRLSVDVIDGEFYWRCCRLGDFNLVAEFKAIVDSFPEYRPVVPSREDNLVYLRECTEFAHAILMLRLQVSELFPAEVFGRLLRNELVSMRPFATCTTLGDDGRSYKVRVFSGTTTGADVEATIRGLAKTDSNVQRNTWTKYGNPHHAQFKDSDRSPEAHRIRSDILFDFVTEPNSFEQNFPRVVSLPYVLVEVTPPLGPAGSIAHQYDSFVRNERQWHLRLPGEFRKQETDVALRTWAVGLLLADGMRFTDAMRDVCEVIDVQEVSQTRFGQDRQGLTQRVPEAKPFVYAREER